MKKILVQYGFVAIFGIILLYLNTVKIPAGSLILENVASFGLSMVKVIPCAFILIGLFEVWVKKETVEHHFGKNSGLRGHISGILLAGTTVGGLYVAFPVAAALFHKGARLAVIFSYIGAAAIVRIPMTIFEASFLGIKFTLVRLLVSLPLVILTAELFGRYLERHNFRIREN